MTDTFHARCDALETELDSLLSAEELARRNPDLSFTRSQLPSGAFVTLAWDRGDCVGAYHAGATFDLLAEFGSDAARDAWLAERTDAEVLS